MKAQKKSGIQNCPAMPLSSSRWAILQKTGTLENSLGFTFIELIVVCAIIGLLATLAMTVWPKYVNQAKEARAMSEIRTIETAVTGYMSDNGDKPANLLKIGYDTLNDPWNHPYKYEAPGRTYLGSPVNGDYDLYSEGPDGTHDVSIAASPVDIIRASNGSFVGLAVNYP